MKHKNATKVQMQEWFRENIRSQIWEEIFPLNHFCICTFVSSSYFEKHDDDIQTVITWRRFNGFQNFFYRIEATLEKLMFMMSGTFLFFILNNKKNEVFKY